MASSRAQANPRSSTGLLLVVSGSMAPEASHGYESRSLSLWAIRVAGQECHLLPRIGTRSSWTVPNRAVSTVNPRKRWECRDGGRCALRSGAGHTHRIRPMLAYREATMVYNKCQGEEGGKPVCSQVDWLSGIAYILSAAHVQPQCRLQRCKQNCKQDSAPDGVCCSERQQKLPNSTQNHTHP